MDLKADFIMNYYRNLIRDKKFDEIDIIGFLIFIRSFIDRNDKYNYIKEFADLVAHRERNKGKVKDSIKNAIDNNYKCDTNSKEIMGYNGIYVEDWKKEWISLGNEFNIFINEDIIKEITLCIFSLAQKTIYKYKDENKEEHFLGVIEFIANSTTGQIGLATTEGKENSLYICFSTYNGYIIDKKYDGEPIKEIIHTCRDNGILKLKDSQDNLILEI